MLYPEGRRHSPITPQVAAQLAAMVAPSSAPRVFAKVGDSITASTSFLTCFDGSAELGAHTALAPTLAYFAASNAGGTSPYARTSLAATGGWTAHDVLAGSPSPLDQELDAIDPRYAVVMFGTNDDRYGRTLDAFGEDMWTIVDDFCARGVIPILSTIPPSDDPDADARVPLFDGVIRALAQGYQVPLVDFHAELVNLPSRGLGSDGIHPTVAPTGACDLSDAGLQYGYNVRNLITQEALDRVRSALAGNAPDATAPVRTGRGTHADPVLATIPVADLGDTRDGDATFSAYAGCGAVPHIGRELVYQLDVPAAATLDAEIVRHAGDDVDVYVLAGSLSPAACKAGGGPTVTASVGRAGCTSSSTPFPRRPRASSCSWSEKARPPPPVQTEGFGEISSEAPIVSVLDASADVIEQLAALRDHTRPDERACAERLAPLAGLAYDEYLVAARARSVRDYLLALLHRRHGNVSEAARAAGVLRETLHRLIRRHRVDLGWFRDEPS